AEGAITAARTLLETVCKHILDSAGESYDDAAELPKLYSQTATHLNLSPSQHSEQLFKQVLGGCQTVVAGLGAIRNRHSDAHGKGSSGLKPAPRHAELAVNLAGAMATFLLQTWEARRK
ncbi:MAG: abortive infection family protein, partial [Betaproteobacteria bacterium]